MFESDKADFKQSAKPPAPTPGELRRFRMAMCVVLVLCFSVFASIFVYGDSPRATIDRMNPILATLVVVAFAVLAHAMWRFRTRCGEWPGRPTTRS
jgi:hypothetical protein